MNEWKELINSPIVWAILSTMFITKIVEIVLLKGQGQTTEKKYYHDLHTAIERIVRKGGEDDG